MKGGMYDGSEGGTEGPPIVGKGPAQQPTARTTNGDGDNDRPDKPVIDSNELGPKRW